MYFFWYHLSAPNTSKIMAHNSEKLKRTTLFKEIEFPELVQFAAGTFVSFINVFVHKGGKGGFVSGIGTGKPFR